MIQVEDKDMNNDYKFIAKKDSWFKEGSEVQLTTNCIHAGDFIGVIKVTENSHTPLYRKELKGKLSVEFEDQELCQWEEFDIYNTQNQLIEVI